MQRWVVHPVVLAVHDVVADLHVFDNLGDTQRRGGGEEHGRDKPEGHQHPATDFQGPVEPNDPADVTCIPFAKIGDHLVTNGVQVVFKLFQLCFVHRFHGDSLQNGRTMSANNGFRRCGAAGQSSTDTGPLGTDTQS